MKYMNIISTIVAFGFASASFSAEMSKQIDCPEIPMPQDGLIIDGNHFLPDTLVFPKEKSADYSGCSYAWFFTPDEKKLISTAKFEHGELVMATDGFIAMPPVVCNFESGKQRSLEMCNGVEMFWKYAYDPEFMKKILQSSKANRIKNK